MLNPNAILYYLEKINNRTVKIGQKTLLHWQTVMNCSSSKMIPVAETKLALGARKPYPATLGGQHRVGFPVIKSIRERVLLAAFASPEPP